MDCLIRTRGMSLDYQIERGVISDYKLLADFHYRSDRPANFVKIYTAIGCEGYGAGFRHRGSRRVIGVLVESMPTRFCKMRDVALGGRYSGLGCGAERMMLLNREMRVFSRVIVDPCWRGLGVASALVRHGLAHADTLYTEATAMMGHVSFLSAGGCVVMCVRLMCMMRAWRGCLSLWGLG